MASMMTLEEAIQAKRELDRKVGELLDEFNRRTYHEIKSVSITRLEKTDGHTVQHIVRCEAIMSVPALGLEHTIYD